MSTHTPLRLAATVLLLVAPVAEKWDLWTGGVPIYVGEFGAVRWVPGAATFLHDQTELFEQYGWNYAVYVWRGDEPYFDGFNLEYGPDPENHTPILDNPLLGVLRGRWTRNVDFPGPLQRLQPSTGRSTAKIRLW